MTREQLFLQELPLIERVIAWTCARHCLRGADAEDFGSCVKLRFIENDYEILARFQGRSSLKTYLTAVIQKRYLDYQAQRFGKWRPSAEARKRGPLALRLEVLLYRDGLTFDEACGVLRSEGRTDLSRDALYAMSLALPPRTNRKAVTDTAPEPTHVAATTVEQAERQALAERIILALRGALGRLPARARIVLRLHFEEGLTLAQVAKALGEDQKGLYRRTEAIYRQVRADLFQEGVRREDVEELLSTLDWDAALTEERAPNASPSEAYGSGPPPPHGETDPEKGSP